jgi:hypothetical protein
MLEAKTNLDVETGKMQFVLIVLLGLFFVPMGLGLLMSGISNGFNAMSMEIGGASLAMYALVVWLVVRANRKSVKNFSEQGLTRGDGRRLAWTDLQGVVRRMGRRQGGGLYMWRCEINFKDGEAAWIIPSKINNFEEVIFYVDNLPCEHVEK